MARKSKARRPSKPRKRKPIRTGILSLLALFLLVLLFLARRIAGPIGRSHQDSATANQPNSDNPEQLSTHDRDSLNQLIRDKTKP